MAGTPASACCFTARHQRASVDILMEPDLEISLPDSIPVRERPQGFVHQVHVEFFSAHGNSARIRWA